MWFKYGLGASALYLSLRPVTVGSGRMGIGFCFFQGVLTKAGAWDFRHARFTSLTLPFQAFRNGHTCR